MDPNPLEFLYFSLRACLAQKYHIESLDVCIEH